MTSGEHTRLSGAIDSVRFADEILVVNCAASGCADEAASGFRVIECDLKDAGAQKNFAMEQCSGTWILLLADDEEVTEELAVRIKRAVNTASGNPDAYSVPRLSRFIDRFIRHGGWYPDRQIRLVKKGKGRFPENDPDHQMIVQGAVGRLKGDILRYSFNSIEDYIDHIDQASSRAAAAQLESGSPRKAGAFTLAATLAFRFLKVYFFQLGFLEGRYGFILAWLSAYEAFLTRAKIWQPEAQSSKNR